MEPLTALPPFLQYGVLGLCALILLAWFWSVTCFVKVMDKCLDTIPSLIEKVGDVEEHVEAGNKTAAEIRDRMLQWECPFRHAGQQPAA